MKHSSIVLCIVAVHFVTFSYQIESDQTTSETRKRSSNFDILDFRAYILKPINIDYKAIYPDREETGKPLAQALTSNHDLPIAAVVTHQRPTVQPLRLGFQYFTDYFRNSAFEQEPHSAYFKSPLKRPQIQQLQNKPRFEFLTQEKPLVKNVPQDQGQAVISKPPPNKRDSTKDVEVVTEVTKKLLVDHVLYYPEEVKKLSGEGGKAKNSVQEPPKRLHIVVPDKEPTTIPAYALPITPPKRTQNNHNQRRKVDVVKSTERPNIRNKDPIFDNVRNKTTLKITYDRVDEPYKPYKPENEENLESSQSRDNVVLETPPKTSTEKPKKDEQYFQDSFMSIKYPHLYEFGHIFDKLHSGWEERFERMNLKDQRFQGRVKWGTSDGGFGEHVWDLNHH